MLGTSLRTGARSASHSNDPAKDHDESAPNFSLPSVNKVLREATPVTDDNAIDRGIAVATRAVHSVTFRWRRLERRIHTLQAKVAREDQEASSKANMASERANRKVELDRLRAMMAAARAMMLRVRLEKDTIRLSHKMKRVKLQEAKADVVLAHQDDVATRMAMKTPHSRKERRKD